MDKTLARRYRAANTQQQIAHQTILRITATIVGTIEGVGSFQATQSCATLPNVNEMTWYAASNPCWDRDELWTTMGHLYKGGIWFKKKAYISRFNANKSVLWS